MDKRSFLLVDDDADERMLFCMALKEIVGEISCITASDGKQALDMLLAATEQPNIIFMDINMPTMSGFECMTKLKAIPQLKDIPVVIYSTSNNPRDMKVAFDLGAAHYCIKGDDLTEMKHMLAFVADNLDNLGNALDKQAPQGFFTATQAI
jgi:CheY-like chemotaxis protein